MASVSIDRDIAIDLVNTKLNAIVQEINDILRRWKYDDPKLFIQDTRNGSLEEAEDDAISLMNLLDVRDNITELKRNWVT